MGLLIAALAVSVTPRFCHQVCGERSLVPRALRPILGGRALGPTPAPNSDPIATGISKCPNCHALTHLARVEPWRDPSVLPFLSLLAGLPEGTLVPNVLLVAVVTAASDIHSFHFDVEVPFDELNRDENSQIGVPFAASQITNGANRTKGRRRHFR